MAMRNRTLLLSPHPDEAEAEPMRRFFFGLAGCGLLREHEWEWSGVFGSCICPVCEQAGFLWFTDREGDFRFGCRDQCDRHEILAELGMDGFDLVPVRPKWLKRA